MRKLLPIFLMLLLTSCLESNPQPAPGKTGDNEDPTTETNEDTNKGAPQEGDATWDGAVDLGAVDARPEPADLAGEVTDAVLEVEISDDDSSGEGDGTAVVPIDGGPADTTDTSGQPDDIVLTPDVHDPVDQTVGEVFVGDSQLTGGGTYFGECFGACKMDATIDGELVNFVASNWDDTIYVDNDGTLTAAGLAKSKELAAALVGIDLEEVYGCPDCADGGGAYVLLRRNGVESKHDYPFGQPFTALTGSHEFIKELLMALAGCQSTENITVGEDCGPLG